VVYADCPDLVLENEKYLDMISWANLDLYPDITLAALCWIDKGILEANGKPAHSPARIYVDNALLLERSRSHMEMVLAALIEAIFMIIWKSAMDVWQCPLAMNKWLELVSGQKQTILGLVINTN
jgi:hypothetical protein